MQAARSRRPAGSSRSVGSRNPLFHDPPRTGNCSEDSDHYESQQPPIMPPSLALLSALFLDNPILRFQMFGGVCNASLQRLTHLDQSLFLKFPATLGSDYCGHDPITLSRDSLVAQHMAIAL